MYVADLFPKDKQMFFYAGKIHNPQRNKKVKFKEIKYIHIHKVRL